MSSTMCHHFNQETLEPEVGAAYIAGAQFFKLNRHVYALNAIHRAMFSVDDTCAPLLPIMPSPTPESYTTLDGITFRTVCDVGLEYWKADSGQWEPIELFSSCGDAVSANPSLVHSIRGIELEQDQAELEEQRFYSYGYPPTWESITRWVEDRKACQAPRICPLKGCNQELRRPHALKDHLLFKFEIKAYKCTRAECGKLFSTKSNCDRHMKNCGAVSD